MRRIWAIGLCCRMMFSCGEIGGHVVDLVKDVEEEE
jgi:hypothetical protein